VILHLHPDHRLHHPPVFITTPTPHHNSSGASSQPTRSTAVLFFPLLLILLRAIYGSTELFLSSINSSQPHVPACRTAAARRLASRLQQALAGHRRATFIHHGNFQDTMPSHSGFFVWINIRPSRALAGPRILPDSSYQDFEFFIRPLAGPIESSPFLQSGLHIFSGIIHYQTGLPNLTCCPCIVTFSRYFSKLQPGSNPTPSDCDDAAVPHRPTGMSLRNTRLPSRIIFNHTIN
jgi:hypothetical protein